MSARVLAGIMWGAFAIIALVIGYFFLAACELGSWPLFGYRYCQASAAANDLSTEQERERALRARVREAETRIASLPACAPATPVRPAPARK